MISIVLILAFLLYMDVLSTSLTILAIAGIITVIGYKWPFIFKHASIFYSLAVVLSVISVVFYTSDVVTYITRGFMGYALFFTVMMMGVLPNKWTITRQLKKNRGVFSIMGFILISPHAFLHVFGFFNSINLFGIVAYVLMIPLTIISFRIIRNEISPKDWFTIQKAAYAIYIVLFAHLLFVGNWEDKVVYAVLATLYVNNKLWKEFKS